MVNLEWLVAYADCPGRYFVVRLVPPRWYYVFDHLSLDGDCTLQSQSFQSLTKRIPSEQIYSEDLAGQAAAILQTVSNWFKPLPICKAPEYSPPPPMWLFGTSPDTYEDMSILLALRMYGGTQQIATLSFSKEGELDGVEAADEIFAVEAREAFHHWTASGNPPT